MGGNGYFTTEQQQHYYYQQQQYYAYYQQYYGSFSSQGSWGSAPNSSQAHRGAQSNHSNMNHYYSFIEEQANKQAETMTAEYLKQVKGGDNQPNEQG